MIYNDLNFEFIRGGKSHNKKFVFLHGWGHDITKEKPIAKLLSDYDCYLIDFPGFGKSPMPDVALTIEDYTNIIADFIKEIKKTDDKIYVVGHSFGGKIALELAAHHDDLVDEIFVVAGAGLKKRRKIHKKIGVWFMQKCLKIAKFVFKLFKKDLSNTAIYQKFYGKLASSDYKKTSGVMRDIIKNAISFSSIPAALKIKIPTVFIYGEKDTITPPYFGKKYQKLVKNSKFYKLANFTHNSILIEGKYQVSQIILKHIGD